MLHKKDFSRIRFQRVAESTGKEAPAEEIVKGYEIEKNQYVILADEELREVASERSTGIEIQEFINETEISSLYFENPYYLEPDKGAGKAFALLGVWGAAEQNAELRILFQIRSTLKSRVPLANRLWERI